MGGMPPCSVAADNPLGNAYAVVPSVALSWISYQKWNVDPLILMPVGVASAVLAAGSMGARTRRAQSQAEPVPPGQETSTRVSLASQLLIGYGGPAAVPDQVVDPSAPALLKMRIAKALSSLKLAPAAAVADDVLRVNRYMFPLYEASSQKPKWRSSPAPSPSVWISQDMTRCEVASL